MTEALFAHNMLIDAAPYVHQNNDNKINLNDFHLLKVSSQTLRAGDRSGVVWQSDACAKEGHPRVLCDEDLEEGDDRNAQPKDAHQEYLGP